ncbi:MAG TPA: hypothetical protein VGH90_07915 [Chthoniobacteraceae bacterium]
MIDSSKLLAKGGNYKLAPSNAVTDRVLLDIATQFENQVSRKMTALTPEQIEKRYTTSEPILETTKYDGEGVFVSWDQSKGIFAFNAPSGRVRLGLPVLEKLEAHLRKQKIQKALFRTELYLPHTGVGKRPGIADVLRTSFNGSPEEIAGLRLAMLDIIMLDGKDLRPNEEHFQETWDLLGRLFGSDADAAFQRPHGTIIPEKELARVFKERVAAGEEGLVARRLQRLDIAKIKPHVSIDAVVVGYVEGEFEGKYGVTSLLTALNYPEKEDGKILLQTFARVGSGLTDQQREEMLRTFAPLKVTAPIAMTDSDGRTVHFVKPVHIVELHGEDLVTTSSRDKENRTQLFACDGERFDFLGLLAFPRLTFATFHTMRGDKTLAAGGARIEQVVQSPGKPQWRSADRREPKIIRREVYAKGDAIRKLVVLETAGEPAVPYVVHWTDYSAKRKDPLKVTTQCAYTAARAEAHAARLLEENVTKGFLPIGSADAAPAPPLAATVPEPATTEPPPAKPKRARTKKTAEEK